MKTLLLDFDKKLKNKKRIICSRNQLHNIFLNELNDFDLVNYEDIIKNLYLNYPTLKRWIDDEPPYDKLIVYVFNFIKFVKKNNINTIVSNASTPHHIEELIIEIASLILDLKILYFYPLFFKNQFSQYPNCIPIFKYKDTFKLYKFNTSNLLFDKNFDLSLFEYEKDDRSKKKTIGANFSLAIIYVLILKLKKKNKFENSIIPFSLYSKVKHLVNQKKSINFYNSNISENINVNRKSLIFMAHFQPEASSWPLGGYLNNQLHLMMVLKKSFPNYNLFYKEHYKSFIFFQKKIGLLNVGKYRNIDYYKFLKKIGVNFVNTEHDPTSINDNFIVVTMTGNIALTRALSGKPTIISGNPWYKDLNLHGIFQLKNIKDIQKNYFKKVDTKKIAIKNKNIILKYINHNSAAVRNGTIDQSDAELFLNKFEKNDYTVQ